MSFRPEHESVPQDEPTGAHHTEELDSKEEAEHAPTVALPEIPSTDLSLDFATFIDPESVEGQKIQKRASNVMRLAQENEKLKAELKAMTDRLEAAERAAARRREQQRHREQRIMEEPSS